MDMGLNFISLKQGLTAAQKKLLEEILAIDPFDRTPEQALIVSLAAP